MVVAGRDGEYSSPPSPVCAEDQAMLHAQRLLQSLEGVQVYLLGGDWSHDHCGRAKHRGRNFDSVRLSTAAAQLLGKSVSSELHDMLADEATICIESAKFLLPLGKDAQLQWAYRLREMAQEQGFEMPGLDF